MKDLSNELVDPPSDIYGSKNSIFQFDGGKLTEFHVHRFLPVFCRSETNTVEAILAEAIKAWAICPSKIIRSDNRNAVALQSNDFVHSAMCLTATKWLSSALTAAHGDEHGSEFLDNDRVREFPWDLFFKLGGLEKSVEISSTHQFLDQLKNQRLPVQTVAAVGHILREELDRRVREPHRKPKGLNTAHESAAQLVQQANSGRKLSKKRARDYWEALLPSSPLIYAATQVGDGQLFRWLLEDPEKTEFFPDAEDFAVWFNYANKFAAKVLSQFQLSSLKWLPFEVTSGNASELPPAKPRDEIVALLSSAPTG